MVLSNVETHGTMVDFNLTNNYLEKWVCTVSISSNLDRNNVNYIVLDRANQALSETMRMSNSD